MKKNLRKAMISLLILTTFLTQADVITVKSGKNFDELIEKHPFAVVLFYEESVVENSEIEELKGRLNELSEFDLYKEGKVAFVIVEAERKKLEEADKGKGTKDITERKPTIMLFKRALPVKEDGKISQLIGYPLLKDIREFVDTYFENDIKEYIKNRSEENEEYEDEGQGKTRRDSSYVSPHLYIGWGGWPYWGYRYGYGYYGPFHYNSYPWGYGFYGGGYRRRGYIVRPRRRSRRFSGRRRGISSGGVSRRTSGIRGTSGIRRRSTSGISSTSTSGISSTSIRRGSSGISRRTGISRGGFRGGSRRGGRGGRGRRRR